jgi:DNA-nicking Smr family endonuclease
VDFGEILKVWELDRRPPESSLLVAPTEKVIVKAVRAPVRQGSAIAKIQTEWLDAHGVPETSGRGDDTTSGYRMTKREIDRMPIDATLDLHGMTTMEAELALDSFFARAVRTACHKVLIVHGKGLHSKNEPVLAGFVRLWLERQANAGRTGKADQADGGGGATWVLIKLGNDQRSR